MSYGFDNDKVDDAIKLPKSTGRRDKARDSVQNAVEAGRKLGFVERSNQGRRRPGPKRTEPQGKLTITGPVRVLERLQLRCDKMGGVPYWQAVEALLDATED